ncbi:MAG: hypothetical protein EPN41_15890 [Candidimonas sp.]|nr:MAG: hypothetical protein EPN41_15890 [Candidimonas sp.]
MKVSGATISVGDAHAKIARRGELIGADVEAGKLEFGDADLALLNEKAGRGISRGLAAQAIMGGLATLLSWAVAGWPAGVSALVGGSAYFVPNALFAFKLLLGSSTVRSPSPRPFFVGEALKLTASVSSLGLAVYLGHAWLLWPFFLFGLLCVLHGYVLQLAVRRLR